MVNRKLIDGLIYKLLEHPFHNNSIISDFYQILSNILVVRTCYLVEFWEKP